MSRVVRKTHRAFGSLSLIWFWMLLVVKLTYRASQVVPQYALSIKYGILPLHIFKAEDTVVGRKPSFEVLP